MTENESRLTKRLQEGKALCIAECEKECTEGYYECHKCKPFADVLVKLAEYEDIGTVDEFKALKEKAEPKEMDGYYCPICRHYFEYTDAYNYCPVCGQKMKSILE